MPHLTEQLKKDKKLFESINVHVNEAANKQVYILSYVEGHAEKDIQCVFSSAKAAMKYANDSMLDSMDQVGIKAKNLDWKREGETLIAEDPSGSFDYLIEKSVLY